MALNLKNVFLLVWLSVTKRQSFHDQKWTFETHTVSFHSSQNIKWLKRHMKIRDEFTFVDIFLRLFESVNFIWLHLSLFFDIGSCRCTRKLYFFFLFNLSFKFISVPWFDGFFKFPLSITWCSADHVFKIDTTSRKIKSIVISGKLWSCLLFVFFFCLYFFYLFIYFFHDFTSFIFFFFLVIFIC